MESFSASERIPNHLSAFDTGARLGERPRREFDRATNRMGV